jgi:ligand-binding sensor domain-containing protein
VWFAVLDGLIIYDGQTWTRRIELSKAIGDANPVTVNAGYQDSDGYIWLARGSRGVIRLDERSMEWKKYNPMQVNVSYVHDGLDDLREAGGTGVSCIYEDRNGRLWFAASDGRVYVHDGPSWSSYNLVEHVAAKRERAPAMPSLHVSAIYQDSSGQMMFATDRGLVTFRENENKWSVLTSKNSGLPADLVYTIMEDKVGRIWLGTKGVLVLEQ